MRLTITFHSDNPNTIYAVLKRQLDREPTHAELTAEVKRILSEGKATR